MKIFFVLCLFILSQAQAVEVVNEKWGRSYLNRVLNCAQKHKYTLVSMVVLDKNSKTILTYTDHKALTDSSMMTSLGESQAKAEAQLKYVRETEEIERAIRNKKKVIPKRTIEHLPHGSKLIFSRMDSSKLLGAFGIKGFQGMNEDFCAEEAVQFN